MRSIPKLSVVLVLIFILVGLALGAKECPNCGTQNLDDARYCKNCGYRFEIRSTPSVRVLPLVRARIAVAGGVVQVRSTPEGATVAIDGQRRGTTPLDLVGLKPGQHEVELSRSGYRSYYGVVVIPELYGTVVVTTVPPGASILLDGDERGVTGDSGLFVHEVARGSHSLLARLPGYDDEARTLEITEERPVSVVTVMLHPARGFLSVGSDPDGAELLVDGQHVGPTQYIGMLAPSEYSLVVTKQGFRRWSGEIAVQPAETTRVFAELKPLRRRKPVLLWVGITALAGGAAGTAMGEVNYRDYKSARSPDEAAELRQATQLWDWVRNIGVGVGVTGLCAYLVF